MDDRQLSPLRTVGPNSAGEGCIGTGPHSVDTGWLGMAMDEYISILCEEAYRVAFD
jgi:hypothetical protein